MKHLSVLMGLLFLYPAIVLAEPPISELVEDSLEEEPLETSSYFQTGLFYRLGGSQFIDNTLPSSLMMTLDFSFLKLDPNQPTWGWGIHSAFSNDESGGMRFAPKAIYRIPFSNPTGSFFETSAGVYFLVIDDLDGSGRLNFPGCFAEAGVGRNHVSIVLGAEVFPTENFSEPKTSGSTTNYWLGLKASQEYGLVTLGATGIVIGLFIVGLANSGIVD